MSRFLPSILKGKARVFVGASLVAVTLTLAGGMVRPAAALEYAAGRVAVAEESCRNEVYEGFISGAEVRHCQAPLFALPSSAAFRCGLYQEAGVYPSGLMRKACNLFDSGVIKTFVQDVVGESTRQD